MAQAEEESTSQLVVTFEEPGSTRFDASWKGVDPLQMVALARFLNIRADLVIQAQEAKKMNMDGRGPRILVPTLME